MKLNLDISIQILLGFGIGNSDEFSGVLGPAREAY